METDKYNYVGTCVKVSDRKRIYYPGPEGLDYFKNKDYLLEDSDDRLLCYIPAVAFKKDKHGKKCFVDYVYQEKPELGYTKQDLFSICGCAEVATMLMFHLLNGAVPERFYKILIKEGLIELSPRYARNTRDDDLFCSHSHPWIFKAYNVRNIRERIYQCDHYWYNDYRKLLNIHPEWSTSIYSNMYQAWYLIRDRYFSDPPENRTYLTWGEELLRSEAGIAFVGCIPYEEAGGTDS